MADLFGSDTDQDVQRISLSQDNTINCTSLQNIIRIDRNFSFYRFTTPGGGNPIGFLGRFDEMHVRSTVNICCSEYPKENE